VGLRRFERQTITLHTKDENMFEGVLRECYRDCWVLDNPVFIEPTEEGKPDKREPLGGKAVFPRDNISYFQVV
jgi:hypothetical protein